MVVIGTRVLLVPVRAVRQSLDPAGGAQLQAIVEALPFWPSHGELRASAERFIAGLNQARGTDLCLPNPPPAPTSAGAVNNAGAQPALLVPVTAGLSQDTGLAGAGTSSRANGMSWASGSTSLGRQGLEMPPDTFSRPAKVSTLSHDHRMDCHMVTPWMIGMATLT